MHAVATTTSERGRGAREYRVISLFLILLHAGFMLCRYGRLPIAPVVGDEAIINDPAVSLAQGQGYVATSFGGGKYNLDHIFAHFPPLYGYVESLAFRAFGISVYSLRATTTVMSIASTVVLAVLLYRLCQRHWLHWDTALMVNALYCTSVGLVTLERVARMESMIGLLTLLSLAAVVYGATQAEHSSTTPAILLAGTCGALALAVHPGAVTAFAVVAPLILFGVPGRQHVRVTAIGLFAALPVAIGLLVYGRQAPAAVGQLIAIARDSDKLGDYRQWLHIAIADHSRAQMNSNVFLLCTMLLLALALAAYVSQWRRGGRGGFRQRLAACVAVSAVVDLLLMLFVFRMDVRRVEYLFGPLLALLAVCVCGPAQLKRWQRAAGWALAGVQCAAVVVYLAQRRDEPATTDPQRYAALIHSLPQGASVAASPQLWLDLREARRPFTLLFMGLGEGAWDYTSGNPLTRFDIILLDHAYAEGLPVYRVDAQEGRTKLSYSVGADTIDVYTRVPYTPGK